MKILKIIVINIILCLFVLIPVEYFLNSKNNETNLSLSQSRVLRLREFSLPNKITHITPGPIISKYAENLTIKPYRVETDERALIKSETSVNDPEHNILFIGGSTTECLFVEDTLRFPSLVGKYFIDNNKNINTYNSGVSGNNTLQSINLIINKFIHSEIDYIVLMHNINDLTWLSANDDYYKDSNTPKRKNLYTMSLVQDVDQNLNIFKYKSYLFRLKKAFNVVYPNLYEHIHYIKKKMFSKEPQFEFVELKLNPVHEKHYHLFKKNLLTYISICRSNNIEPILMTQFNRINEHQFNNSPSLIPYKNKLKFSDMPVENYCNYYHRFNEITREVAKEQEVFIIDLDRKIPKDNKHLYDLVHLNNEGSLFTSSIIYKELESHIYKTQSTVNNLN